jgi:hypothetical protein
MTADSSGQPPAIEGERVARVGARWTREEEEQLVVEVRAGTDLAEIARAARPDPGRDQVAAGQDDP